MPVDLDKLRSLFDLLIEKDIGEFEHEDEHVRFRVLRGTRAQAPAVAFAPSAAALAVTAPGGAPSPATAVAEPPAAGDVADVTSPFVGTFYRSPTPDAPSFVEVGSVVRPGQTLCIIEAMKLMNEIEAECAGTVVECYAQNGKAVEFGQKLFRIKKA